LDHKTSGEAVARVDLGYLCLPPLLPPLLLVRVLLPRLPICLALLLVILLLLAQLGEALLLDGRVCWVIWGVAPGMCIVKIIRPLYSTLKSLYNTLYPPRKTELCLTRQLQDKRGLRRALPGCSGVAWL
jgi:hypothetical protein